MAQVHGPLSTEALKPSWVRSSVADCNASGTSIAVPLWSTGLAAWVRRQGGGSGRAGTKATPTALASQRPAPISFAREGRDEQHMSGIPKSSANPKKCKSPSAGGDLPLVLPGGQSVLVAANGRLADVVVRLPQVVHGLPLQGGLTVEQICRGVPQTC